MPISSPSMDDLQQLSQLARHSDGLLISPRAQLNGSTRVINGWRGRYMTLLYLDLHSRMDWIHARAARDKVCELEDNRIQYDCPSFNASNFFQRVFENAMKSHVAFCSGHWHKLKRFAQYITWNIPMGISPILGPRWKCTVTATMDICKSFSAFLQNTFNYGLTNCSLFQRQTGPLGVAMTTASATKRKTDTVKYSNRGQLHSERSIRRFPELSMHESRSLLRYSRALSYCAQQTTHVYRLNCRNGKIITRSSYILTASRYKKI